jgi:putative tryptophan/tyrosine transport system substrate-binding protein
LAACFTVREIHRSILHFFNGLRRYGFVEGQNLLPDSSGYGLRPEQLASHASEIANQKVDVIVCAGDQAIRAAQQATQIIPRMDVRKWRM